MKKPFRFAPQNAVQNLADTIQRALASAGLDGSSSLPTDITATVRRALASRGPTGWDRPRLLNPTAGTIRTSDVHPALPPQLPGSFETHEFSSPGGRSLAYKLYIPTRITTPPPLIVMLHGCTQSAADFAAGTGINALAEEHGFLALYPEQSAHANVSKCWNWFKAEDQARGSGEPALLAGLVREVAARHDVDRRRIFVSGLSAGAAMALVLGQTYPELFAGVGAHSGLAYASAHDVPSAMAAMKGVRSRGLNTSDIEYGSLEARRGSLKAIPTIVFHGDRDHTVQSSNGARIVDQATGAYASQTQPSPLRTRIDRGTSPGGRGYTRTVHADLDGTAVVESWTVHGAGHAWSGGQLGASYTDRSGPDASTAMVRFFLALPRAGSA